MKKKKKGQITLYIVFLFLAIIIILMGAVIAPVGVRMSTALYEAGEELMLDSVNDINGIEDINVRNSVNQSIQNALSASQNNIDVSAGLFQYSWVFLLLITAIVVFIQSRRVVEFSQGGGFI